MYSISTKHERRLLWLLALTQFTIIMDFMVMMPLGPQIMHSFSITPAAFATAVSAYSWCSGLSGLFAATSWGMKATSNPGAHGLSQIVYQFS